MEQDIIVKFCVMGQPGVGKTSMLYQYVHKKFDQKVRSTIGCDFSRKLKNSHDGKPIRIQFWDIAGQQRFNNLSKMYLRGALGCVVVCSATQKNTIYETQKWKKIIEQNSDQGTDVMIPCILVMNKSDMISVDNPEQFQSKIFMEDFCRTRGFCGFVLTSAKENKNIEEAFQTLLNETISRGLIKGVSQSMGSNTNNKKQQSKQPSETIKLSPNQASSQNPKQKKKCCG